ncbi:uncharacterized protein [Mytilus edulis]|uniref:uncharacterized protein n=1 Tax=Mytilus edulis TaxID=6550 RepID=UPI0039EE76DF
MESPYAVSPTGSRQTSSSCPDSDDHDVSSDNVYEFRTPATKRLASGNCPGTKQILPEWVCNWKRRTVEHHLNIYYEKNYLNCPHDVLNKVGNIEKLSDGQMTYVSMVNSYLHFDAEMPKKYAPPYAFYSQDLKPVFDDILNKVMTTPVEEEIQFSFARIKVHRFIKELRRLLEVIEEKKKTYEVTFEANYSRLLGTFAEMCCLEAVLCTSVDQTVWKNLSGLQITSKPDFRFYKCGILESASDVVVSGIEVKRDFEEPSEQANRKKELSEPSKKKIRVCSASSSSSASSTNSKIRRSTKSRTEKLQIKLEEKPQIEIDLNKKILGQHAGELLLDLDRYRVSNEKLADLSNILTMPGMILDGTKVFFTLLEMTVKHHTRLHYNQELDEDDRATVYYSRPLDILIEKDRQILIENFVRLNNIP